MGIFFVFLFSLIYISQVSAIEFYYTIQKNVNQCFEHHLAGQTLMTGEVSFVSSYPVQLNIENPDGTPAVSKVNGYYS